MKYYSPSTIAEYFDIIQTFKDCQFTLLSGGTDLVPRYENNQPLPLHLIDIKKLEGLKGIVERDNEIEIGSLTSIEDLKKSRVIQKYFTALWMAATEFAGVQIRHRATIGGNICNASPAGDTLPPLYAFNAKLKVISQHSQRLVPISKFITGPGEVDLKSGEILQSVILHKQPYKSTFYKLGLRSAMAIAVVNFSVVYKLNGRTFSYLTVTTGAVAPTIVYLKTLTDAIVNNTKVLGGNFEQVNQDIAPITDIRATSTYRQKVLINTLRYTLNSITNGIYV